jgi:nucleoside-diphosphate-sugar epimerase
MQNRTLITGANGFFGSYLINAFINDEVDTLGLSFCSINHNLASSAPVFVSPYSKVVHAAGKAHSSPKNKDETHSFYQINYSGTINLTRAFDQMKHWPRQFLFVSTVGVYGKDEGEMLDENTPLAGILPYQKSKIMAELYLQEWSALHHVELTILRLPLLVGKNPPGNLGAMIRAIKKGYYFRIGKGDTRRSMVLAEDVAALVASNHLQPGIFNLTDGIHPSFKQLEESIALQLERKIKSIPQTFIKKAAKIGDHFAFLPINSYKLRKLQSTLTFSDKKARVQLDWNPRPVIANFMV